MTIGIGFRCEDGIVIAADTQYTRGPYKGHGPKVFPLFNRRRPFDPERPDLSVVIAGAGKVAFMRRAVDKIENALSSTSDPTLTDVQQIVEDELRDFFETYLYPKPDYSSNHWFDLILGVWTRKDGFGLFQTGDVIVTPENSRCTIGMGFSVAEYALGLTHQQTMSVDNAIFPAALCIKAAKDYVDYCGGKTQMWTIRNTTPRRVSNVHPTEIAEAERYSEEMFDAVRNLIAYLETDNAGFTEDEVDVLKASVGESIVEFRQKQKGRKETIQRIREQALKRK